MNIHMYTAKQWELLKFQYIKKNKLFITLCGPLNFKITIDLSTCAHSRCVTKCYKLTKYHTYTYMYVRVYTLCSIDMLFS